MSILLLILCPHPYVPRIGEFGCITDQVGQYLLELTGGGADDLRHVVPNVRRKGDTAHARLKALYIDHRVDDLS